MSDRRLSTALFSFFLPAAQDMIEGYYCYCSFLLVGLQKYPLKRFELMRMSEVHPSQLHVIEDVYSPLVPFFLLYNFSIIVAMSYCSQPYFCYT